jgi:hypothetical protein
MRLTERSMLTLANDVHAADFLAADIERRRREHTADDRHARTPDPLRVPWPGRLTSLRRLIPGGGHA